MAHLGQPGFLRSVALVPERATDGYPFDISAIGRLGMLELDPRVSFLVGENGSGKSTLVEAIAVAAGFNAEGGDGGFFILDDPERFLHHLPAD